MEKRYCGVCGAEMISILTGAENYYYVSPFGREYPYSEYNIQTGKRQFVAIYYCLNQERGWFKKKHDMIIDEKIILKEDKNNE